MTAGWILGLHGVGALTLLAIAPSCGGVVEKSAGNAAGGTSSVLGGPGTAGSRSGGDTSSVSLGGDAGSTSASSGSAAAGSSGVSLPGVGESIVTLSTVPKFPTVIALDSSSIYFADWGTSNHDGGIWKAPLAGGPSVELAANLQGPGGIAVDDSSVYFSADHLMRIDLDGTNPKLLADGVVNDPIALGQAGIYGTGKGAVVSVPLAGGSVNTLVPSAELPNPNGFESYGVAVDDTSVYLTTFSSPMYILKVPVGGGSAETIASSPGPGGAIAIDEKNVYWADASGVMKVSKLGGPIVTLSSVAAGFLGGVTVDQSSVYWTGASTVQRAPLDGGPTFTLATGQYTPGAIAVDAGSVYWANTAQGGGVAAIVKATPK